MLLPGFIEPKSIAELLSVKVHVDIAATVSVPVFTEFVVSGVVAESVTNTFAASVFPARSEGIVQANEFDVDETPVNSMFATRLPDIVFTIR